MRFGGPQEARRVQEPVKKKKTKIALALVLAVITVGVLGYLYTTKSRNMMVEKKVAGVSEYYAVFLDNDQVYFGKMISKSKEEMTLSNVYYLQANTATNAELNDQRFTLIKLGQELHGPTEEMKINVEHVVFYEQLREDSKVVGSIRDQK